MNRRKFLIGSSVGLTAAIARGSSPPDRIGISSWSFHNFFFDDARRETAALEQALGPSRVSGNDRGPLSRAPTGDGRAAFRVDQAVLLKRCENPSRSCPIAFSEHPGGYPRARSERRIVRSRLESARNRDHSLYQVDRHRSTTRRQIRALRSGPDESSRPFQHHL